MKINWVDGRLVYFIFLLKVEEVFKLFSCFQENGGEGLRDRGIFPEKLGNCSHPAPHYYVRTSPSGMRRTVQTWKYIPSWKIWFKMFDKESTPAMLLQNEVLPPIKYVVSQVYKSGHWEDILWFWGDHLVCLSSESTCNLVYNYLSTESRGLRFG